MSHVNSNHKVLLKSQRAYVGQLIINTGLDINDFTWGEEESSNISGTYVPVIKRNSSDYCFIFDKSIGDYGDELWDYRYSPGSEDYWGYGSNTQWGHVAQDVLKWTRLVDREEKADDPWSDDETAEFEENWQSSNEKFSDSELAKIKQGLDGVQAFLIDRSNQQPNIINEIQMGIQELKQSATTVGRKDWLMLFIGWFFTHSADWSVNNVHWHELIKVLLKGTHLFLINA